MRDQSLSKIKLQLSRVSCSAYGNHARDERWVLAASKDFAMYCACTAGARHWKVNSITRRFATREFNLVHNGRICTRRLIKCHIWHNELNMLSVLSPRRELIFLIDYCVHYSLITSDLTIAPTRQAKVEVFRYNHVGVSARFRSDDGRQATISHFNIYCPHWWPTSIIFFLSRT